MSHVYHGPVQRAEESWEVGSLRARLRERSPVGAAALASVRYGFSDLGLKQIIGLVMPENITSVRVLEKTGLRYADTVTFWGSQFSKYVING